MSSKKSKIFRFRFYNGLIKIEWCLFYGQIAQFCLYKETLKTKIQMSELNLPNNPPQLIYQQYISEATLPEYSICDKIVKVEAGRTSHQRKNK